MTSDNDVVGASLPRKRLIRVLEIIGNAIVGGMESTVYDLIRSLPQDEFEVSCVCPYESPFTAKLRSLGCKTYITSIRDDPPWHSIEMVATIIEQQSIDIVHAHLLNAHTLAAISGRLAGVPVVATIHSMTIWTQEISVARLAGSSLITVCQQAFAQAIATGVPSNNVHLISNGVDVGRFRSDRDRGAFRAQLGIPLKAPLLGFVGRLSPEKGPDKFIQAAERICRAKPDVYCVMVGEGPEERSLRHEIGRYGLEDRILLAGAMSNTENIYPEIDILLQTSRSEAMPLAVIEAMACGIPVIALAVGGVPEIIEAGTTGIHISPIEAPGVSSHYPGDWPGIACAALDLIARPDLWSQMGKAGRARVVELFNLKENSERIASLFRQLATPAAKYSAGKRDTPIAQLHRQAKPRSSLRPIN